MFIGDALIIFLLFILAIIVTVYVVSSLLYRGIFRKAGIDSKIAWIPVYRDWKFLELGGVPGWIALSLLITSTGMEDSLIFFENIGIWFSGVVFLVFWIAATVAAYNITRKLGKNPASVIMFASGFLTIFWYFYVLTNSDLWDDSLGRPSLAKGTIVGYAKESDVENIQ